MKTDMNLRIPGPTPLPPEVLEALSKQVINHRGHKYEEIQKRVTENLKYFFQTENDIFLLTSSGMGGLEAATVNFFSPGDTIISFTCGEFGSRWADVARAFSANVIQVKIPLGEAVDVETIAESINNQTDIKGVFITLNETATGVWNKIADLAPLIHNHRSNPLLLIDGISGLGAIDLPMDEVGVDVLVTASQKAWMAPPGLAMIGVSEKAWERNRQAKMPRYYFDLAMYKKFAEKYQTPATGAVSTIFGLDRALEIMKKEGREAICKRHLSLMKYLRQEIKKLDLELFVSDDDASPTVTSVKIPEGVDGQKWLETLREKHHVVLAGGMGETKGKIIRIAHMGYVSKADLADVVNALKNSLKDLGKSH